MSMSRRVPAALAAALVCAAPAWSQFSAQEFTSAQKDPRAFTIDEKSVTIEKLGPVVSPSTLPTPPRAPVNGGSGGGGIGLPGIDQIINTGLKIWKIIVDNKPVVDINTQYATALPSGLKNWTDMAGWLPPAGMVYEMSAKNLYGMKVIDLKYQVLRTYGGSYHGTGRYLTAVTIQPLLVNVAWGYHFSMESSVPDTSIVNVGTSADPVAGLTAQLGWRISTALKDSSGQSLYFLQGDGAFREVGAPFSAESLKKARIAAESIAPSDVKPARFD